MDQDTPRRPKCSVFIATSLDGYIARTDGSIDWLDMVQMEGEDYGFHEFFDSVDALILGRKTYDTVLGFPDWPYAGKRCIILTHRPDLSRHGEEFYQGDATQLLDRLGEEGIQRAYVDGGNVIQQFLEDNLIDDLTLSIIPLVLGDGNRLFARGETEHPLTLESSRAWGSGLVQLRYRLKDRQVRK